MADVYIYRVVYEAPEVDFNEHSLHEKPVYILWSCVVPDDYHVRRNKK